MDGHSAAMRLSARIALPRYSPISLRDQADEYLGARVDREIASWLAEKDKLVPALGNRVENIVWKRIWRRVFRSCDGGLPEGSGYLPATVLANMED